MLDPDEDPEDQPSPAQSGQDGDEAQSGEAHANYEEEEGWDDSDAASGSDQVVLQPGSSGGQNRALSANAQVDQVDDGDPRPGPSSCSSQQVSGSAGAGGSAANNAVPDEGSNSADFWAASSSGGGQSGSASREVSQDNSPGSEAAAAGGAGDQEELPACSDAAVGPNHSDVGPGAASSSSQPSQSPRVVVSLASFSPQPSSSSSFSSSGPSAGCSSGGGGGAPSQSSSVSFSVPNGGASTSYSLAVSSTGASSSSSTSPGFGLSSSSVASPNSANRSIPDAPVSLASESPLLASSSSFSANPQPASPVPSGSQPLHGEISNPPSPLGGSRPAADLRRAAKRDYPDSPIPGPSGTVSGAKRPCQDPQPGSSGVAAPVGGASEAAAAVQQGQDEDEDENGEEMSSAASSSSTAGDDGGEVAAPAAAAAPSYSAARSDQPLTPADNFMISSSTGMGLDSIPATPVDIHGDNDLSVPSPGIGLRPQVGSRRVVSDDAVDSTVDSTGLPLTGGMGGMEYENAEFCQSSRYLDSSDDDDDDTELQTAMAVSRATHNMARRQQQGFISSSDRDGPLRHHHNAVAQQGTSSSSSSSSAPTNLNINDDSSGISTSGQVDEGQFRLVPNAPEDDSYNKTHPPRRSSNRDGNSSASVYVNPQPGPSRHWGNSSSSSSSSGQHREAVASMTPVANSVKTHQESFPEQNFAGQENVPQGSNGNGEQPEEPDNNSPANNNLDGLLPCPAEDLQLEPQLSSSFMDSSNFGHPVDLEDIQLQKFIPEQQQARPQEPTAHASASNGLPPLQREAGSSGLNNQHSSILESMTGPLSKRLRTLHNLQQMQSSLPSPSQPSSSSSQQPEDNNGNNTPAKKPANKDEASSSGIPPNGQDSSDSNHSNGGNGGDAYPGSGNGPTTHTYSVTIEHQMLPPSLIMKPKRMFEQKMWGDQDAGDKNMLHPGVGSLDPMVRPRRVPKTVEIDPPLTISDAPVQSRAKATLPASHLAIKELSNKEDPSGRGVGVFAKKRIPKGCRFGPMEGVLRDANAGRSDDEMVLLIIAGEQMSVLDTTDDDTSNWMKFVRLSSSTRDQNLQLVQRDGQIFFEAVRAILQRQELRVNYSPEYASQRNLPLPEAENQAEEQDLWQCYECGKNFPTPEQFQAHLNSNECQQVAHPIASKAKRNQQKSGSSPVRRKIKVLLPERAVSDDSNEKFHCHICSKQFSKEISLARHVMLHNGDKRHSCDCCKARFSHPENLAKHKRRCHNVPIANGTKCVKCNLWFRSPEVYRVHLFSHHPEKSQKNLTVEDALAQAGAGTSASSGNNASAMPPVEMKFQCPECLAQFHAWLDLVGHVGQHGVVGSEEDQANKAGRDNHKCELCYKSFTSEERLQRHMGNHGSDDLKPLSCDECGRRFLNNSALAGHVKIHAAEKNAYDCPICGQLFEQIVGLKDHVHIHCINGQYECPQCHKSFSEYSMVRKHIRAFHGKKKFVCQTCDKSFVSSDKLKLHAITHSDVKEFACMDCGKQFKRKDKLGEHIQRMHSHPERIKSQRKRNSRENPNQDNSNDGQAEVGGREKSKGRFVPKVSPTDYHRFIYKCHECLLGFKRRGMLVNHLAKRHPGMSPTAVPELNLPILKATKDYYCQYCSKVYKSSSKRKAHILKNHPGQNLPLSARSKILQQGSAASSSSASSDGPNAKRPDAASLTFSATVGSVTTQPHSCPHCHKQYASNAKLLQHQRKKHREQMPPEKQVPRSNGSRGGGSQKDAAAAAGDGGLPRQKPPEEGYIMTPPPIQQQQPSPPAAAATAANGVALITSAAAASATPPHDQQQQQQQQQHYMAFDPSLPDEHLHHQEQQLRPDEYLSSEMGGGDLLSLARVSTHQEMVRLASNGATIIQVAQDDQDPQGHCLVRPERVIIMQQQQEQQQQQHHHPHNLPGPSGR